MLVMEMEAEGLPGINRSIIGSRPGSTANTLVINRGELDSFLQGIISESLRIPICENLRDWPIVVMAGLFVSQQ